MFKKNIFLPPTRPVTLTLREEAEISACALCVPADHLERPGYQHLVAALAVQRDGPVVDHLFTTRPQDQFHLRPRPVSQVMQRRHTHLLTPPPPLSRLLRLLHLDQDVLLVCEVHHPPCEGPPHLKLQQSVVPKVGQVHRCQTRTLREKRHRLKSFSSGFMGEGGCLPL